ncbi:septum formation inhibitor Maf [Maribacter sp. 2307ULW6-5]|uniref:septum formation inhibitor Maf n=1 Tax=Maribacter sp. 2307ULW6-5 TaxID=3386275 RepID=UPI0039BC88FC
MMFKKWLALELSVVLLAVGATVLTACKQEAAETEKAQAETPAPQNSKKKKLPQELKDHWYAGKAEISSYRLQQVRYGEKREGQAVLVYVTEPFLPKVQVKADRAHPDNIPVLKLNATKNYLTGIYPYSIMSSTFFPVYQEGHAVKVTFSAQEWCGQTFMQLNNRDGFHIVSHSYFEGEADQDITLEEAVLENELWTQLRLDPDALPTGNFLAIPSFEYLRLEHKEIKAYEATAKLENADGKRNYSIDYPELGRGLTLFFEDEAPYQITGWEERSTRGQGENARTLTSTAQLINTLNTPYWEQNGNEHAHLRDSLGL